MKIVNGIIRISKYDQFFEHKVDLDLSLFAKHGYTDISYTVPVIRLLKRVLYHKPEFIYKPLLFNYGFIHLPIQYTRNKELLRYLVSVSQVISGFIFRDQESLYQEQLQYVGPVKARPVLIETISSKEIAALEAVSKTLDVYPYSDQLAIGSYVILQGYPFANLLAKIVSKSKTHFKVELASTGTIVSVQKENIFYTTYLDSDSIKEIPFTELGYTPEISTDDELYS